MKTMKSLTVAASVSLALALTFFACSSDNDGDGTTSYLSSSSDSSDDYLNKINVRVGGIGILGSFVDLDQNPPVAYTESEFEANVEKIDLIYGPELGGGDYLYTFMGACYYNLRGEIAGDICEIWSNYLQTSTDFSVGNSSIIIPLPTELGNTLKEATKYSDLDDSYFESTWDLDYVEVLEAMDGQAFSIITSENGIFDGYISQKNGTTSITLTIVDLY
jgi:hypothetical protein